MGSVSVLVLLLLLALACGAAPATAGNRLVLSLSDLHLDPDFGATGGLCPRNVTTATYGCDSPLSLIKSAIAAAAALVGPSQCPDLILITGDQVRHHLARLANPADVMQRTVGMIQQAFTDAFASRCPAPLVSSPVWALGNNDLYPRYPAPPPPGQADSWLSGLVPLWKSLSGLPAAEQTSFRNTGFYKVQPWSGLRLLVLHTNYWDASNSFTANVSDPAGGFAWLESELAAAAAAHQTVWLMGHIPNGVDHFSGDAAWHPAHQERFQQLLLPGLLSGLVRNVFFGHEHVILNRAVVSDLLPGAFLHGSISPIYNDNPSIRLYRTTDTAVVDFTDHYLDLTQPDAPWRPVYAKEWFAEEYGVATASIALPMSLGKQLAASASLREEYAANSITGAHFQPCGVANCSTALYCNLLYLNRSNYEACLAENA